MTHRFGVGLALLLLITGCVRIDRPESRGVEAGLLTASGRPVHPLLIKLFSGWISDGDPIVRAVDPDAAEGTDEFAEQLVEIDGDLVQSAVPGTDPPERFAYRHVGTLRDKTLVIITQHQMGGSGVFETLLLLRWTETTLATAGRSDRRRLLMVIDSHPLGDRDSGLIRIAGDHVWVGPSQHRSDPLIIRPPRPGS
jgi:hypothetical protein